MNRFHGLAWVLGVAACGGSAPAAQSASHSSGRPPQPRAQPMPHQACVGSGGDVQEVDVNGDGRPDIRTVMRNGHVFCRESDANFDGRTDIVRFFDEAGQVTRVEDDYDFDGRVDLVGTYENGQIVSDVLDTNFDGRTDTWRDYRNGHVVALRRDANGDGRVDMWEEFDETGRLTRSAVDADGNGQPDWGDDAGAPVSGAPPSGIATTTTTTTSSAPAGGQGGSTGSSATPLPAENASSGTGSGQP